MMEKRANSSYLYFDGVQRGQGGQAVLALLDRYLKGS